MAAPMKSLTLNMISRKLRILGPWSQHRLPCLQHSISSDANSPPTADDFEEFERKLIEKRIAQLRDVSGMNEYNKSVLRGKMPEINSYRTYFKSRYFHRKMYAAYGAASGSLLFF